jgi:hypothetical protein
MIAYLPKPRLAGRDSAKEPLHKPAAMIVI